MPHFFRSKAGQLAEHLRAGMLAGEIVEPLPAARAWSRALGVSRPTLASALHQLEREGLVRVESRAVRIVARPRAAGRGEAVVRVIFYSPDYPHSTMLDMAWLVPLSERLHRSGIRLGLERCSAARLAALAAGTGRRELFLLASLPDRHQRLFERRGRPTIVLGGAAPGVTLPNITIDLVGAVRHATWGLLRRGHDRLWLVATEVDSPGLEEIAAAFEHACAAWRRHPVERRRVRLPSNPAHLAAAACRLAEHIRGRTGVVVDDSVPVSLLMTALLGRGVRVPEEAELVALSPSPDTIMVYPRPAYYPFPVARWVKTIGDAASRFFESGEVPRLRKVIGIEPVPAEA